MIVLNWVSEHYSDFDENGEFLDWFEEMLVEDVSMIMCVGFICGSKSVGKDW